MRIASQSAREAFVEKVFATLTIQLASTIMLCWALITRGEVVLVHILRSRGLAIGTMFAPAAVAMLMNAFPEARRKWPTDVLFLGLFTLSMSLVVALCISFVPLDIVMRAGLVTAAVTGWLTLYARTTSRDFTRQGGLLARAFAFIAIAHLIMFFVRPSEVVHVGFSLVATAVLAGSLVVDTQRIVGGRSSHGDIRVDEHVLACVNLYTDIVGIFLRLLHVMDAASKRTSETVDV